MKHKKCVVKTLYKENTNGLLVVFTLVFVFIESGTFFSDKVPQSIRGNFVLNELHREILVFYRGGF